jgi:hypothetical protein
LVGARVVRTSKPADLSAARPAVPLCRCRLGSAADEVADGVHVSGARTVWQPWKQAHKSAKAEMRIDADPHGLGRRIYAQLCKRLVQNGTTAVALFGTQSVEAKCVGASRLTNALVTWPQSRA